ncbi:hypothetical protein BCR39DRAFT_227035 [Naematelia encephala]|uniref:Uncharacterized protein n=1 Tax=Naematelia encephala TaxID=71784 RepID=A0A1Y2AYE2_9TREE|nr:hypothetical protein BCR39DRAFT_227035 [Naematelia encephala]
MRSLLRGRPIPSSSHTFPSRFISRPNSTTPPPSTPGTGKVEPTTFSERSSPRQVHPRPEAIRGLPPVGTKPAWSKTTTSTSNPSVSANEGHNAVNAMAFEGPSRPRMLYERVGTRELPNLKNRGWYYLALAALGLGGWGAFLLWATNAERIASSVFKSLTFQLRTSPDVIELLGRGVRPIEQWYTFGDPWISGSVCHLSFLRILWMWRTDRWSS